jgi:hypothetical protein
VHNKVRAGIAAEVDHRRKMTMDEGHDTFVCIGRLLEEIACEKHLSMARKPTE